MRYYEVFIAGSRYHGNTPLTYSSEELLALSSVVTVPLRGGVATGFITAEVDKPDFATRQIKTLLSEHPLPHHCLELATWLSDYYGCTLGEALRQFAPTRPTIRKAKLLEAPTEEEYPLQLTLTAPLTDDQEKALTEIRKHPSTTILLHGDTGTGKTRVYMELAQQTLKEGRSVILLTPEIALTPQLAKAVEQHLGSPAFVLHSQLRTAKRKQIWLAILESAGPIVIIGPRSALFSPVHNLGLVVVDEAHEPAYKQEQTPRYHTSRVASQLGSYTEAKVILGTATPAISDYYVAKQHKAIIRMTQPALGMNYGRVETNLIDLKKRNLFSLNPYLSNQLIDAIKTTVLAKKQVMLYLNRRGSARIILCTNCGWQLLCPNCDIPLVYHADDHLTLCHICGFKKDPPSKCPSCSNTDIIYKSIGTKALVETVSRFFPYAKVQRFDSDNLAGEQAHEHYAALREGKVDILIGTQLLAKGFDLPNLELVGIIAAETSLSLPDYTAEERTFQLLYQVMGRVGRGHGQGRVVVQSYNPQNTILRSAIDRDWNLFYKRVLEERRRFRFPPFSYLLKLTCRRATLGGAQKAADRLKEQLASQNLPVEVIGPAPSFYARRGRYYYYQLVLKSKERSYLVQLAKLAPANWMVDLDPIDLL